MDSQNWQKELSTTNALICCKHFIDSKGGASAKAN